MQVEQWTGEDHFVAYTDGASRNPGPSGVGVVIINSRGEVSKHKRHVPHATSNQAELLAVERAIDLSRGGKLTIRTDSKYAINSLTKNRKRRSNVKIIDRIKRKILRHGGVEIRYVKGHAGLEYNEMADTLAKAAMKP